MMKKTTSASGWDAQLIAMSNAPFGMLDSYMKMERERLHAQQSTALFKVDLPQAVAIGQPVETPLLGLVEADVGTPVLVFGFCLGKLYIAAAFNPIDPSTRVRLKEVMRSGKFTCITEFNSSDPSKPYENFDLAYTAFPAAALFEEALRVTEGMVADASVNWPSVAAPAMFKWLVDQGFDLGVRKRVHFRGFSVVPTESNGEVSAGWR
jgi:hypothetical protein